MKKFLLPLVLLLHGCAAPRVQVYDTNFPMDPSGMAPDSPQEDSDLPIQHVLLLSGDCPNWQPALDKARAAAGCPGVTASPSASVCKKRLPCDVCKFLEDGAWPTALLAHAMFHESLHLCKAHGAYGPTTEDLPWWDPRDDADAVTKTCGL